ncbi:MAG: hypothetical protein HFG27_02760 [Provencibacterium sp.]|nr:hypothetical protein [Provencibacterium sp.]
MGTAGAWLQRFFYKRLYERLTGSEPCPITHGQVKSQLAVIAEAHRQNDKQIAPLSSKANAPPKG